MGVAGALSIFFTAAVTGRQPNKAQCGTACSLTISWAHGPHSCIWACSVSSLLSMWIICAPNAMIGAPPPSAVQALLEVCKAANKGQHCGDRCRVQHDQA